MNGGCSGRKWLHKGKVIIDFKDKETKRLLSKPMTEGELNEFMEIRNREEIDIEEVTPLPYPKEAIDEIINHFEDKSDEIQEGGDSKNNETVKQ